MSSLDFGCLPTVIGGMPQTDAGEACSRVARYLKDIPAWPQLPNRSWLEDPYVQFSEGCPGIIVDSEKKTIQVDRAGARGRELENLLTAYDKDDYADYRISPDYAAGLHTFLSMDSLSPMAVKGQVTGPVSWGLTITGEDSRPVINDRIVIDAAAKLLRLKASWMENRLAKLSRNTIVFVDEPCLGFFDSESFPVSKEKTMALIKEVLEGINGIKGVHCCNETDWSFLFDIGIDILSFDTYSYPASLARNPEQVKKFIYNGRVIAWGIVPHEEKSLAGESVSSLKDRLEEAMAPFTRNEGLPFKTLVQQSLVTPGCSLASVPVDGAERALELLVALSDTMRRRYL
ncbi:MAG: methionine synthase [Dehalococcoidales bacterium]|nr:methionine synthase [Dehalococcoidales bacterium]